jgi:hypothetical protein
MRRLCSGLPVGEDMKSDPWLGTRTSVSGSRTVPPPSNSTHALDHLVIWMAWRNAPGEQTRWRAAMQERALR